MGTNRDVSFARSLFACLLLAAPMLGVAAGQTPAPLPQKSATPNPAAPLDRYFGSLQMSPLGIRQNIDALARYFEWRTITDDDLVHQAEWIEQSLTDWQQKFPRDNWLPPTAFHLMELYAEVQTESARSHATEMLHYIITNFPDSKYAHLSRIRLAQGFPPFHDEPTMRPTPTPVGMTPPPTPSPEPTETPTETPSPSPTPSPVPTKRPPHALFGR